MSRAATDWQNAGYDWREKCPLGGADLYLWGKFQRLKKGSWLRRYYKDGWEAMHQPADAAKRESVITMISTPTSPSTTASAATLGVCVS